MGLIHGVKLVVIWIEDIAKNFKQIRSGIAYCFKILLGEQNLTSLIPVTEFISLSSTRYNLHNFESDNLI